MCTGWTTWCGLDLISFLLKPPKNLWYSPKFPISWNERKKLRFDLHAYGVLQWNWHIPAKEFEMMIIIMVMYLLGSLLLAMQSLPFPLPMSIHTNVLFKCRSVRQILCIPNTYFWALLVKTTGWNSTTKIWIFTQSDLKMQCTMFEKSLKMSAYENL